MDWTDSTWWWVGTGVLVAAELATSTFYLLMLALGTAAAAVAAHLGAVVAVQLAIAAVVGGGGVALWHRRRSRQPAAPPASANRDVVLDVGERVQVTQWAGDGTARVTYRGATWSARFGGSGAPAPGEHVIRAVDGNRLVLDRVR
jgi:membrane protein implicated in regulation of membrane protease activity